MEGMTINHIVSIDHGSHKVAMQRNPTTLNGRRPRPGWTSESRDRLKTNDTPLRQNESQLERGDGSSNETFDHGFCNL